MTDRYTVEISPAAKRQLKRIDQPARQRLITAMSILRDHPRPPTATRLVGHPGYLRVRVGDYRIVYTVDEGRVTILVLIGHQRDDYRKPPG